MRGQAEAELSESLLIVNVSTKYTMAAPSTEVVTEMQLLLTALRVELKEWEKLFAAAHEGRKPGREDIKRCPEIGLSLHCSASSIAD